MVLGFSRKKIKSFIPIRYRGKDGVALVVATSVAEVVLLVAGMAVVCSDGLLVVLMVGAGVSVYVANACAVCISGDSVRVIGVAVTTTVIGTTGVN
jgi:hypothetical protein